MSKGLHPLKIRSDESKLFFTEPSLTKQSFKDECDINNIMDRFNRNGLLDHVSVHQGQYGDFLHSVDYHTALNQVYEAEDMFMTLPAKVRSEFKNDPGEFLGFVSNPDNRLKMAKLGLLKPDVADSLLREEASALAAQGAAAAV